MARRAPELETWRKKKELIIKRAEHLKTGNKRLSRWYHGDSNPLISSGAMTSANAI
jgi:hypothetical protein